MPVGQQLLVQISCHIEASSACQHSSVVQPMSRMLATAISHKLLQRLQALHELRDCTLTKAAARSLY